MHKRKFGIMQGRLLPKILGQFQCFPAGYGNKNLNYQKIRINKIEFIFDDFFTSKSSSKY